MTKIAISLRSACQRQSASRKHGATVAQVAGDIYTEEGGRRSRFFCRIAYLRCFCGLIFFSAMPAHATSDAEYYLAHMLIE